MLVSGMKRRSPTLEGFRSLWRQPSLGVAEIAWRWSIGGAAAVLGVLAFFEYLGTLTVTRGDLLLLRSRRPTLISQAMAHILRGSGWRAVQAMAVLVLGLAMGWIVISAIARAATVRALVAYFRKQVAASDVHAEERLSSGWRLSSLLELNFFRVALTLAAFAAFLAAFILGGTVSPAENPSPGAAFLLMLSVIVLVWLAWSVLNWFLSVAAIFVIRDGRDAVASIAATLDLCQNRIGSVFAAGTWFGLAHVVCFFVATTVVAFPLGLAGVLPPAITVGGILLITLLYFAVVDFLYVGRLAAYVAMLEIPEPIANASPGLLPSRPSASDPQLNSGVDADELILSDHPALG